MPKHSKANAVPVLMTLATWTLFVISSSPSMGWLDSPEFVAASQSLGVAHSPGHPLPIFLGKLGALIPVGDLSWRIAMTNALMATLSVLLLWSTACVLLTQGTSERASVQTSLLSAFVALTLTFSWAAWSNALRAEVYALQGLLFLISLRALFQWEHRGRTKFLWVASLGMGLALANHHWMALMTFLPCVAFVFSRRGHRPTFAVSAWTFGIGLAALSALLYLPIRSMSAPEVNFGAPHTLARFFWTLSGAAFSKSAHLDHGSFFGLEVFEVAVETLSALTWPLALLAFLALGSLRRSGTRRRSVALLWCIAIFTCLGRALLGFDEGTPDHYAYLLPAIFSLGLVGLMELVRLVRALQARILKDAGTLAVALMAIGVLMQVVGNYDRTTMRGSMAADEVAEWEMSDLPPRSLILPGYFQTSFRIWALHAIHGTRPDVIALDRSFLSYPGHREQALARTPQYADILNAPLQAGLPTPIAKLQRLRESVWIQPHPNLEPEAKKKISPRGAFAMLKPVRTDDSAALDDPNLRDTDIAANTRLLASLKRGNASEKRELISTELWYAATRLSLVCSQGRREWARQIYRPLIARGYDDDILHSIALHCGLENESGHALD